MAIVDMTASMNWYRMFDKIQSVRVMGVVESVLMTPVCRNSAYRAGQARRHHRHRDDAGDEELDEPILLGEHRCLRRPDEWRMSGHPLVHHREPGTKDLDLRACRAGTRVVDVRDRLRRVRVAERRIRYTTDQPESPHERLLVAAGNREDEVHLLVLGVLRGVDGRLDGGD